MGTLKGLGKEEEEEEGREGGRGGRDEWDRLIHKHTQTISGKHKMVQLTSMSPSLESIDSRPTGAQRRSTPIIKPFTTRRMVHSACIWL